MTRAARWLITGAGGMVGTDLLHTLQKGNAEVVALTKSDLDITNGRMVDAVIPATSGWPVNWSLPRPVDS